MKTPYLLPVLLSLFTSVAFSQNSPKVADAEVELQRSVLLSDVRNLAIEIPKLDGQLARALAHAEIADAVWTLDRKWAKRLLKEAYQFTYLTEEEQQEIGPEPPGTEPRPPTTISRARNDVRKRILSIAGREKSFADQLISDSTTHVTKDDRQMMQAQMALMALAEGDKEGAVRSIEENMKIDPTQLIFVQLVNDLALKDRAAADKLILQCITNLLTLQVSNRHWMTRARADMVLRWLVFPNSFFRDPNKRIPNPGAEVMRAYVRYVLDSVIAAEQKEPGSIRRQRSLLLTTWIPLNEYAPELKQRFMELEALTRIPGNDASLPTKSYEEIDQEALRKKQTDAVNASEPTEQLINSMIVGEDFETARKLISKLPEGALKTQLTEQLNTREAMSLAKKADLLGAQSLAERLTNVGSMLQVYPLIVQGYADNKDQIGASETVRQAIRQLKNASMKPASPGARSGMPVEYIPTASENDAMLATLGKLAKAVLPIDSLLASEVVDDIVTRAHASRLDTTQARTGIDSELFKLLAAKDEIRARSAAESFKDRLRRIVALAAIYQWKATQFEKKRSFGVR